MFGDNDMFCITCLIHDRFFEGGGSWAPDSCPVCNGTETILWKDMSLLQHRIARKILIKWKKED